MTKKLLARNFSMGLLGLTLLGGIACSSDDSGSDPEATGGSAGSSGTAGTGGTAGTAGTTGTSGTSGTSGSSGSAGTSGEGGGGSDELVGTFQLQVTPEDADATTGKTTILGKVSSGPTPSNLQWEVVQEAGDCKLKKPKVPFCDPACGSDVCVADGVCQAYPTVQDAGEVRVTGVQTEDGSSDFKLLYVAGTYQAPGSVKFAFPPFDEGASVKFEAAGKEVSAFTLEGTGIAPLSVTSSAPAIEDGKPLTLTWKPASDPNASTLHVKLDISHHGGTKGMIECETQDSGSLTIDADMLKELVDLGVAGFPTIIFTRRSVASTKTSVGRVELIISSSVELGIEVPGLVSCHEDDECPSGVCLPDLTCE